jgi:Bacterial type II and III secretion system protein
MKLYLRVIALVFLSAIGAAAQEPAQTSQSLRSVVLDIDIIDVNPDQRGEIEKIIRDKRSLDRFIAEGKGRLIAGIQLRARSGEHATARMGQRVPVQVSTTNQGTPQTQYENTGLSVDVEPRIVKEDRVAIKLGIDLTAVVRNQNILAPTFVQRTVNDQVYVRPGEPALLVSVSQHEGLLTALPNAGSKPVDQAGGNFVIVLTARLLD